MSRRSDREAQVARERQADEDRRNELIDKLDGLMTQAAEGDLQALERLETLLSDEGPSSYQLELKGYAQFIVSLPGRYLIRHGLRLAVESGKAIVAEREYSEKLNEVRRLMLACDSADSTNAEAVYTAARAYVTMYYWRSRNEVLSQRLAGDLGQSYDEAAAFLHSCVAKHYAVLVERAKNGDAEAIDALRSLIRETQPPDQSSSTRRQREEVELRLLGVVPPLPWPEKFDLWVATNDPTAEFGEFSPQPEQNPAQWELQAAYVIRYDQTHAASDRFTEAAIILAKIRSDSAVRQEVAEGLKIRLLGIVTDFRASQSGEPSVRDTNWWTM